MSSRRLKYRNSIELFCHLLMANGQTVDRDISAQSLQDRIDAISRKLESLSEDERGEWVEIQVNKLRQLGRRLAEQRYRNSKAWREAMRVFIGVCSREGIQGTSESTKDIEAMIKSTYTANYGAKKAAELFMQAGFSSYEKDEIIMEGEDDEPRSVWRVMCCCSSW